MPDSEERDEVTTKTTKPDLDSNKKERGGRIKEKI